MSFSFNLKSHFYCCTSLVLVCDMIQHVMANASVKVKAMTNYNILYVHTLLVQQTDHFIQLS